MRLTTLPAGPVWWVTSVRPSIFCASSAASETDLVMRTPPFSPAAASLKRPLPRPPAWICALTTQIGPSSSPAAVLASSAFSTTRPSETGTPYSFRSCLA